jgi:Spy/CpxP family protein refolding chaperone
MNKRKIIVIAALTTVIGSGIAFAGAKSCGKSGDGHRGFTGPHKIEHVLEKMSKHLDLSDDQESSLREIMASSNFGEKNHRHSAKAARLELLSLDPLSVDFESKVDNLIEIRFEQLKQQILEHASLAKQISHVLTAEQVAKARTIIAKRMDKLEKRHSNMDAEGVSE